MESSALKKTNKEEGKKATGYEVDQRIYQVGLLLSRKPVSFILQYAADQWKIGARQTRTYMRKARKNWKKHSEKQIADARAYSLAKLRDINDQAQSRKVVIGTVDDKQVIQVPDLDLVLNISKEENKIMGVYPAEKLEVTKKYIVLKKKVKDDEEK